MSARYARLDPLDAGESEIRDSTIAIIGLGATGSHIADNLARLGADLMLMDRDYLEPANLATSALYTEQDVHEQLPKAVAAERTLQQINGDTRIDARVTDVNRHTVTDMLDDADILLDGTDNMETRYLLNEYSVRAGTPWIHVSALGYRGEVMPVIPRGTACFNCVFSGVDTSRLKTCEAAGIRKETAATAANIATRTTSDLLTGEKTSGLTRFNLKDREMRTLSVQQDPDCFVCRHHTFPYLSGDKGSTTIALCGEDKYQVNPEQDSGAALNETAASLEQHGTVEQNEHLLRFSGEGTAFTLFHDGRAIIDAKSEERAKSVYARFIGH